MIDNKMLDKWDKRARTLAFDDSSSHMHLILQITDDQNKITKLIQALRKVRQEKKAIIDAINEEVKEFLEDI